MRCEPHRQAARRESQRAYAARKRAQHTGGALPKCQSILKPIIGRPYRCTEPTKTPTTRGRPPRHCPECRRFRRYRAAYKRWQRTIQKGEEKRERRAACRHAAIENIRRITGEDKPDFSPRAYTMGSTTAAFDATSTTQTTAKACAQPCSTGALTAIHQRSEPTWSGSTRTISTPMS